MAKRGQRDGDVATLVSAVAGLVGAVAAVAAIWATDRASDRQADATRKAQETQLTEQRNQAERQELRTVLDDAAVAAEAAYAATRVLYYRWRRGGSPSAPEGERAPTAPLRKAVAQAGRLAFRLGPKSRIYARYSQTTQSLRDAQRIIVERRPTEPNVEEAARTINEAFDGAIQFYVEAQRRFGVR